MQMEPVEKAKATAGTAMARSQNHRTEGCRNRDGESRRRVLEQAAEVLLRLQFPLEAVEQERLWRLFQSVLEQAYAADG